MRGCGMEVAMVFSSPGWFLLEFEAERYCFIQLYVGIPSFHHRCHLYISLQLWSHQGFPGSSDGRVSACSAGDLGSIPGYGRSPGEGNGSPVQYSCLDNSLDRRAWQATVHGVTESDMTKRLHFLFFQFWQPCIPYVPFPSHRGALALVTARMDEFRNCILSYLELICPFGICFKIHVCQSASGANP